jgi:hypothetical protein
MAIVPFAPQRRQPPTRNRCHSCRILFAPPKRGTTEFCEQCAAGRALGYALARYRNAHDRGWWT